MNTWVLPLYGSCSLVLDVLLPHVIPKLGGLIYWLLENVLFSTSEAKHVTTLHPLHSLGPLPGMFCPLILPTHGLLLRCFLCIEALLDPSSLPFHLLPFFLKPNHLFYSLHNIFYYLKLLGLFRFLIFLFPTAYCNRM